MILPGTLNSGIVSCGILTQDRLSAPGSGHPGVDLTTRSTRVVRLRMKAMGRRHRPFFRICAMDSRTGRDACPIEELGHYDPMCPDPQIQTVLDVSRIRYWLSVGAQPSEKVQAILNRLGVKKPAPGEPWALPEPPAAPATPAVAPAPAPAPASVPAVAPAPVAAEPAPEPAS